MRGENMLTWPANDEKRETRMSDPAGDRNEAVSNTIDAIRTIEAADGVTRPALERIRGELLLLAERAELFPPEAFALEPGTDSRIYRLAEDGDNRFALYMSAGKAGKETPPHDHTTWAVIVGLRGKEHNRLYQRVDAGEVPGKGEVRHVDTVTVERGAGVCLMPDDIHSIHLEGEPPTLMFHMYGLGLGNLPGRVYFDQKSGAVKHFDVTPNIVDMG
jgi:predicted metal-dependent enzyme (double-stranded beta helix superfamily)